MILSRIAKYFPLASGALCLSILVGSVSANAESQTDISSPNQPHKNSIGSIADSWANITQTLGFGWKYRNITSLNDLDQCLAVNFNERCNIRSSILDDAEATSYSVINKRITRGDKAHVLIDGVGETPQTVYFSFSGDDKKVYVVPASKFAYPIPFTKTSILTYLHDHNITPLTTNQFHQPTASQEVLSGFARILISVLL